MLCRSASGSASAFIAVSSRAARCRLQPSAAIVSAITRPMPFEAPVIKTDLPLRSTSIFTGSLIKFEHFAGESGPPDLGGPPGDQVAARAPPHRFDRHLIRQPHRAMELHA